MNYFVFCGKNWDYYFTRKNRDCEIELIESITFSEVYNSEKFVDRDFDNPWIYLQYV